MRELVRWGARTVVGIVLVGALWLPFAPVYSRAVAGLTDRVFVLLHRPFGAQATAKGIELSWQPLRYTTFARLQEQMGYVDRFARRGLEGHRLIVLDGLYLQAGAVLLVVLMGMGAGRSLQGRIGRTLLALGVLGVGQALNLLLTAQIELELRSRILNTAETSAVLQDPGWYLYYGLRPVPIVLNYVLPWLVGGALAYRGAGARGSV